MIDYTQQDQYRVMHGVLNERQWRLYGATEAKRRGPGGISQEAREAGGTRKAIHKGMQELAAGERYAPSGAMRQKSGGGEAAHAHGRNPHARLGGRPAPQGQPP